MQVFIKLIAIVTRFRGLNAFLYLFHFVNVTRQYNISNTLNILLFLWESRRIFCTASSRTCPNYFSYKSHFQAPQDNILPSLSWWSDVPAQTCRRIKWESSLNFVSHLDDSAENVHEGNKYKVVQCCGIRHFWQIFPGLQSHEGHGEDGGDAQGDPVWGRFSIQPKWDPRNNNQQHTGAIHLPERLLFTKCSL